MKRSYNGPTSQPKRIKKTELISATSLFNFASGDAIVDYLKQKSNENVKECSLNKLLKRKGDEFENVVVDYIKSLMDVQFISKHINNTTCSTAIKFMKKGCPILHSVPVINNETRTCGIIDLLIRSDYLKNLFPNIKLTDEELSLSSPKLGVDYHYIVLDIKFCTLTLASNGKNITNSSNFPAYKVQTCVYSEAISKIQGVNSRYALILGRRSKHIKNGIEDIQTNSLESIGVVDFDEYDKHVKSRMIESIQWINDLKNHNVKKDDRRMLPNMCKDSGSWNDKKSVLASSIHDITQIWNCGVRERDFAYKKNIKRWSDDCCTSENLGVTGKNKLIIDHILEINKQESNNISPLRIQSDMFSWKHKTNEIFVDFETLNDISTNFEDFPTQPQRNMIFMIGVGWKRGGKWQFKQFVCTENSDEEEFRIMDEFRNFIIEMDNPKIYYWCADKSFWEKSELKQYDLLVETNEEKSEEILYAPKHNWCDLSMLFKAEPITIKGCFNFKLKSIGTAMKNLSMIDTTLDSECTNGSDAQAQAIEFYENKTDANATLFDNISKYNEYDCQVLCDILSYLRLNHS